MHLAVAATPASQYDRLAVCTLAIYFQASQEYPLVIAANRDEFLARPALPPRVLSNDPWILGGQDVQAGGTWLAINRHHLVAGLLNRRTQQTIDPLRRSRGLLCMDALRASSPTAAAQELCREPGDTYNPFNLLIASPTQACVVGNFTGRMARTDLSPGLHLITNLEIDDPECPRIAKSVAFFEAAAPLLESRHLDKFLAAMKTVLSDHSTPLDPRSDGPPNNLCVHRGPYGTRSSTILAFAASARRMRMWFADGPPCRTAYTEVQDVGS